MSYVTPWSGSLDGGLYEISMPIVATLGSKTYSFAGWENGSLNPTRSISLSQNVSVKASYVEVINVANVVFTGNVSDQVASGEVVTLTVTKPDLSKDILTAMTDLGKAFTFTKTYVVAGSYSVIPSIGADSAFKAATGASVTFTISLQDRTIMVVVTVG